MFNGEGVCYIIMLRDIEEVKIMSKGLLDPKVDFVFKNIFGSEKNPEILI